MGRLLIIAWASMGAWTYRDAQARCADPEHHPVLAQWQPLVWALQVLFIPGFGLLTYIQARRPQPDDTPVSPNRWRLLLAPAGMMVLLVVGFLGGALTAIPTSRALITAPPANVEPPAYRVWQGERRLTAAADRIRYTVLTCDRMAQIQHTTGAARAAGDFVVVRLGIRNEGPQAELISPNRFALVDAQGRQYSTSFAGETALLFKTGRSLSLEARQPGLESEGELVFDVPKHASKLSLAIHPLDPLLGVATLPLP